MKIKIESAEEYKLLIKKLLSEYEDSKRKTMLKEQLLTAFNDGILFAQNRLEVEV